MPLFVPFDPCGEMVAPLTPSQFAPVHQYPKADESLFGSNISRQLPLPLFINTRNGPSTLAMRRSL